MFGHALRRPIAAQHFSVKFYSKLTAASGAHNTISRISDPSLAGRVAGEVSSINSRLENLKLTGSYLSGGSLLTPLPAPHSVKLPSLQKTKIESPLPEAIKRKVFIEETKPEIKDPLKKPSLEEPVTKRIKKHAIRMVILRRRKMRKHQRKRLWDRMYLKFRAGTLRRAKKRELEFRNNLAAKIQEARKFDPNTFVEKYLEDFNTPLVPGTYQGKRLPQWLIMELMENDRQQEKEKQMDGKTLTTKEQIVKPGETVDQFIQRTWK